MQIHLHTFMANTCYACDCTSSKATLFSAASPPCAVQCERIAQCNMNRRLLASNNKSTESATEDQSISLVLPERKHSSNAYIDHRQDALMPMHQCIKPYYTLIVWALTRAETLGVLKAEEPLEHAEEEGCGEPLAQRLHLLHCLHCPSTFSIPCSMRIARHHVQNSLNVLKPCVHKHKHKRKHSLLVRVEQEAVRRGQGEQYRKGASQTAGQWGN